MRLCRFAPPSVLLALVSIATGRAAGQAAATLTGDLRTLVETPAVSGYESAEIDRITASLQALPGKPNIQRDSMGNLTLSFGSGAPHRLIAASVDEPGYIVSKIEPDGYGRVQRLPQTGLPPHYNELQNAQPMTVTARDGHAVPAVTAGLSIHLTPGRADVPNPDDLDNLYVDLGAKNADSVHRSGVDLLSPVAAERSLLRVGRHGLAGTSIGDRYGAALLLELARALAQPGAHPRKPSGTVTLAFVTQQWAGSRGLIRILQQQHPDEVVYLGRGRAPQRTSARDATPAENTTALPALGSGSVRYSSEANAPPLTWFASANLPQTTPAASFLQRGYGPAYSLPQRTAHLGVPIRYPLTAGEMIDSRDLHQLLDLLSQYTGAKPPTTQEADLPTPTPFPALPHRPTGTPANPDILRVLALSYGVSEQERMTRDTVAALLPAWAHPETDPSGNLILRLSHGTGPGTQLGTTKGIVFMAHTDELGFRVKSINPDGTLELDNKGGGSPAFYWGHPALIHTSAGSRSAVVTLPPSFDTAAFRFPSDFRVSAKLDVGASTPQEVEALGIRIGDTVTIPKRLRTLQDGRVTVRSLDDRVGCTALIHAVWALGPDFHRDVTFVWSTQEELGLLGAIAYAEAADKHGQTPKTVFAIDTFVSSDSPLESHRFADATLGDGFVVRAIDNSNIVPWADVQRVEAIAHQHNIPVQYGITGGGNDGAAFSRYGTTDIALSWPLRYSHSPAELIDLRDLDALANITEALAREW